VSRRFRFLAYLGAAYPIHADAAATLGAIHVEEAAAERVSALATSSLNPRRCAGGGLRDDR
jgi:hypothetical protein